MRRLTARLVLALVAAAITVAGLSGAYSYGRDYWLHRGFTTLVQLHRAGTGRLESVTFYSRALHRNADYLVYLPPHYSARHRYPVYYLLHGMPGQPKVFVDIANMDVRLDNQLSLGRARPMILVYPDGRIGGSVFSDSEWANTGSGRFESYVIEVMNNVDHRFATLPYRADRVIAGFSAGAYGAINIALHHPADFGNVQTWSGYFVQTPTGVFAHAGRAALAYNSPIEYIGRLGHALARYPLRVFIFTGRQDGDSRQQPAMVAALRADGAQVQARTYPGGHDWSVWYPRLNEMLDLASQYAAHPLRAGRFLPGRRSGAPAAGLRLESFGAQARPRHRHRLPEVQLLGALLLALLSAAVINLGFVLQHRGHARALEGGRRGFQGGFREPSWLIGQGVGWAGFAGQIVAVALAPLTLVQAFSAGSLALSVPLAARLFGHRLGARQLAAIGIIALSLITLPIGFDTRHGHLQPGLLIVTLMVVMLAASLLAPVIGAAGRAIAAGAFYGAADAAIKATAVTLHGHGGSGFVAGWVILAGLCTFGGFLSFQAALRGGDAVRTLSLMNAFTAVTAVAVGMAAFGEPLGRTPVAVVAHAMAIALVIACVRPLAGAQQRLVDGGAAEPAVARARVTGGAVMSRAAEAVLGGAALVVGSVAALGLAYSLRELGWLATGPRVPDALPLLQLAGFDGQPLARVVVVSALAGAVLGLALIRAGRWRRFVSVAILAALLLVLASDASYALARNLRLEPVLLNRTPPVGPWLEALVIAAACAVPGRISAARLRPYAPRLARAAARARARPVVASALTGIVAVACAAALLPSTYAGAQPTRVREEEALPPAFVSVRAQPRSHPLSLRASSQAAAGRLVTIYFYSRALRKRTDYLVYVPREYKVSRPLPVFYMLHGMPGRPLAFTVDAGVEAKLEALIREHLAKPMILVFPDGRIDGNTQSDSEWANTRSGRFENYVVNVVGDVDRRFATRPCRQDRAIAGLSAGAYGAINIGLHQVAVFGLIQVWSGYYIQTRTGVFAHATRSHLRYNSPLDYVWTMKPELRTYPLRVFLYVGDGDSDRRQIYPMDRALRHVGAKVQYAIYPGGHSWGLWSPRTDQMLIMASHDFAGRCPAPVLPVIAS
ncbi:MAG TPA: alpha/beta hydrolase-fold protein [Solirubrobacteraceae bacterium]|nr:alpha/beta hydrolase-fold protein [Solirubrobacteraceae bacterium]